MQVSNAFGAAEFFKANAKVLADSAASAVKSAEQGVRDAGREAEALVNTVADEAATAVKSAEDALTTVTATVAQAVDFAKDALNSAINAVSDFANKLAEGFFGAISSIFEYSRANRHIMALRELHDHIQTMKDDGFNGHAQSPSPTQTKVLTSGRHLMAFGDILGAFNVVYNGIKGGIEFIKTQLNEAVRSLNDTVAASRCTRICASKKIWSGARPGALTIAVLALCLCLCQVNFARDAVEIAKQVAESEVARVTTLVADAKAAVGPLVAQATRIGDSIISTAEDTLATTIRVTQGAIQEAEELANEAIASTVNFANDAIDKVENGYHIVEDTFWNTVHTLEDDIIPVLIKCAHTHCAYAHYRHSLSALVKMERVAQLCALNVSCCVICCRVERDSARFDEFHRDRRVHFALGMERVREHWAHLLCIPWERSGQLGFLESRSILLGGS